MKQVGAGLASHLSGTVTTVCRCWRVERRDGVVLGFTDHDRDISFDGIAHEAASGLSASEMQQHSGLNADSQQVSGALISGRITEEDIRADRYDAASVAIWLVNWSNPDERMLERICTIGEISREDGAFRAELRGFAAALDQTRGRRFTRACDADLGDARCGISLALPMWSAQGEVVEIAGELLLRVSGIAAFASHHFSGGKLAFLSGSNQGLAIELAGHQLHQDTAMLALWKPPVFPTVAGDLVHLSAGCDKRFSTCRERFANQRNFRGFPHIPGNDFTLGYASSFDVFDGGALVP